MGKLIDFLTGTKILEEVESPINGKISVVKSLAFGIYVQVDGLTQSGGIIYQIWKKTLKKIQNPKPKIQKCLILGLGGGSVANVVGEFWPEAKITGVDLDPIMVEMGKKYLGLDNYNIDVVIGDAYDFVRKSQKEQKLRLRRQNPKFKYDLILVDLYIGEEFPTRFESEKFLRSVERLLSKSGVAVFNRLYYGEKRKEAMKFGQKLEKIFPHLEYFYPEANVMFICNT